MKAKITLIAVCQLTSIVNFQSSAQRTAFTYQGRLNDGASPAAGICDLRRGGRFDLFLSDRWNKPDAPAIARGAGLRRRSGLPPDGGCVQLPCAATNNLGS